MNSCFINITSSYALSILQEEKKLKLEELIHIKQMNFIGINCMMNKEVLLRSGIYAIS